ncbi:MAG: hypothetical protein WCN87_00170 [Chlamydiota bacterium]
MEPLFRPISLFCLLLVIFTLFSVAYLLNDKPVLSPIPAQSQEVSIMNPFEQEIAAYAALDRGALYLKDNSLSGLLKKLQQKLHYFGPNNRPDSRKDTVFIGLKEPFSAQENTPLYLFLDKQRDLSLHKVSKPGSCSYLMVEKEGANSLLVKVFAPNSSDPSAEFHLYKERVLEKEPSPLFKQSKLGMPPILRLLGKDLFLEQHGGSSFAHYKDKERLDLDSLENSGLLFIKEGSILAYQNEKWAHLEDLSEKNESLWLLHVGSIGERAALLTLWSPNGESQPLNILRISDNFPAPALDKIFKYIGTKNLKKWLFEVSGKRVTVTPGSWWLCQNKEWHELISTEEIDSYVTGSLRGELLIFEDVEIENTDKFLKGHIFNYMRSSVQNVRIPIQ